MAKKEENKATDKDKGTKKTESTAKKTTRAAKKPATSGEVKGPTSAEDQKKTTRAKVKEPSKINQAPLGRNSGKAKKTADEKSTEDKKTTSGTKEEKPKLPKAKSKKALPEETASAKKETGSTTKKTTGARKTTGTKAASTGTKADKKTAPKPAKFKDPVVDEQLDDVAAPATKPTAAPNKDVAQDKTTGAGKNRTTKVTGAKQTEAKTTAKKAAKSTKEDSAGEEKETKGARKMSRRKTEEGISAEEKMKMPNTSPTEDLQNAAKKTAKNLADKVIPDDKTQKQVGDMAKSLLPDQETIRDTVNNAVDKVLPDEGTAEQAKKATKKTRETTKKAAKKATDTAKETAEKTAETASTQGKGDKVKEKSSKDKPVEATLISEFDVHLFREGKHFHLYKKLGSHLMEYMGTEGVYFALWAPNAQHVSVIGNFNQWDKQAHPMKPRQDDSGIWEAFVPDAKKGSLYKYFIKSTNGYEAEKGDPYAFMWETPPNTASVVWDLENTWTDTEWMDNRKKNINKPKPMSVYELHVGSWRRVPEEDNRSLSYKELAEQLPAYLKDLGFTHVEFMPVMEHPFFGSWGYQVTGYFAPSSRYGTPQDFMDLIEALHKAGIGVILDWVPSHFPSDLHGLHYYDGTFLYEHADPRKGFHPDWQSYIFNYGRNEVRSFLISNALFWLDKFHADGLRVDAVASMLYLDYSRKEGEWEPNEQGGNENLEAISFLKEFNEVVYSEFPDTMTIAEESTAWPMVSRPTYMGGLGFGMKWMMGWMHDTLEYFQKDPIHRKHHQNTITFSTTYAFTENFMLPLSHDEVVYGKQAIWNKMPGDDWNKFANLRSLYAYMFAHPGTKLLFMGAEFAQRTEWAHDSSLDWHLTNERPHQQIQDTLRALNTVYTTEPAFYEKAFDAEGFEWVDINDAESSVISFLRKGEEPEDTVLVVCNLTPVPRENYRIGVPAAGTWTEIFNSDDENFGGSNVKNGEGVAAEEVPIHNKNHSVSLTLPPMGVVFLKNRRA